MRGLVKNGQIEFANGGWVGSDEACPNYEDLYNNMLIGHQFLQNEFGTTPSVGWHLDSFGHSSTNARLFADLGFEAMFVARHDKSEQKIRDEKKSYEFLWRPNSANFGNQKQILTSIFRDGYCFVPGFKQEDDNIDDDKTLRSFNAEQKMRTLINYIHNKLVPTHQGNHILLPWGCDFHF